MLYSCTVYIVYQLFFNIKIPPTPNQNTATKYSIAAPFSRTFCDNTNVLKFALFNMVVNNYV